MKTIKFIRNVGLFFAIFFAVAIGSFALAAWGYGGNWFAEIVVVVSIAGAATVCLSFDKLLGSGAG